MNILVSIKGISRKDIGDQLFAELLRIYPEGKRGDNSQAFGAILAANDERMLQIRECLEVGGFRARELATEREGSFSLRLHRIYDRSELSNYQFLELGAPAGAYHGVDRSTDGELLIPELKLNGPGDLSSWDFICGYSEPTWLFVPSRVKDVLAECNFQHLHWKATQYWPKGEEGSDWSLVKQKTGTPFWEIESDLILPPVAPSMDLRSFDEGIRLRPGDRRVRLCRVDEHFAYPELHYRESDLANLPSFDVARTYENFGPVPSQVFRSSFSSIVVSNRFYQLCEDRALKAEWHPVHLDT